MEELKRGESRVRLESSRANGYAFELFRPHPSVIFSVRRMGSCHAFDVKAIQNQVGREDCLR